MIFANIIWKERLVVNENSKKKTRITTTEKKSKKISSCEKNFIIISPYLNILLKMFLFLEILESELEYVKLFIFPSTIKSDVSILNLFIFKS